MPLKIKILNTLPLENKRKSLSFKFSEQKKTTPKRVIILGTSGIISSNLQRAFDQKQNSEREKEDEKKTFQRL